MLTFSTISRAGIFNATPALCSIGEMIQSHSFSASSVDSPRRIQTRNEAAWPITVTLFEGLEGLNALALEWRELGAQGGLFGRFDFFRLYVEYLNKDPKSVRFLRFSDAIGVLAIIPLVPGRLPVGRFGSWRIMTLGNSAHVPLSDVPLAPRANAAVVGSLLIQSLERFRVPWSALVWSGFPTSSGAWQIADSMRSRAFVDEYSPSNVFDTTLEYEALCSQYSTNLRASLKKARRRLEENGAWRVVFASNGDKFSQEYFQEFLRLEASGWKGRAGTESAIKLNDKICGFYKALLSEQVQSFACEITLLECNGTAIAAQFSVFDGKCKHLLKIGYDETYAKFSPGQVLLDNVLRDACCNSRIERVSLVTNMPWHQTWRPKAMNNSELVCIRNPIAAWLFSSHRRIKRFRRQIAAS